MHCDIIIPVWNQPRLTKECIDSVIRCTHSPFRLIVIDNGSEKETKDYLIGLKGRADLKIILIRNEQNLGFVKAINQGIKSSDGDYICLLNNDTKVEEGWLGELINVAQSDYKIGIVSPGGFSDSYRKKELRRKWIEIGFAIGACMLIKREVINNIGFFDEAYEIGFWEDTDYCQRAKKAGYICVTAKAAYVFHHSHKTFEILTLSF